MYQHSSETNIINKMLKKYRVRTLCFQADIEQYRMVKEALHERASMLHSAPHLTHPLPIMLPVYK